MKVDIVLRHWGLVLGFLVANVLILVPDGGATVYAQLVRFATLSELLRLAR